MRLRKHLSVCLNKVQSRTTAIFFNKFQDIRYNKRAKLFCYIWRVDVKRGCLSFSVCTYIFEPCPIVQVEGMYWTIFTGKLSNLLVDMSSWKSICIPIVCVSILSLGLNFAHSIWGSISNQDDLVDLLLLIERLEQHLQCFVAPSSFWPNPFEECLQVDWSIFECCAL